MSRGMAPGNLLQTAQIIDEDECTRFCQGVDCPVEKFSVVHGKARLDWRCFAMRLGLLEVESRHMALEATFAVLRVCYSTRQDFYPVQEGKMKGLSPVWLHFETRVIVWGLQLNRRKARARWYLGIESSQARLHYFVPGRRSSSQKYPHAQAMKNYFWHILSDSHENRAFNMPKKKSLVEGHSRNKLVASPDPRDFLLRFKYFLRSLLWKFWLRTFGRWLFLKRIWPPYTEPASILFVRKHTTIPVPAVSCTFPFFGRQWMLTTKIRGTGLHEATWRTMDEQAKTQVISQIARLSICSVVGGPVYDLRLCTDKNGEEEINRQLRLGSPLEPCKKIPFYANLYDDIVKSHSLHHPIVFTHSDIALRDIMVDGTTVTAIIDWECAGWYPAHWEYLKAGFGAQGERSVIEGLGEFIPAYEFKANVDARFGWGLPQWRCI
ncbi:hypothetical protein BDN72DRAFT_859295 [Pluteus cervinus]|uniref:Uncharacterized protein n=1 Tax=Pluteus cervinus TaxID=181527 RepID=A0ACD3AP14_9AGAR|nr:hypothetical protein BDN72DRAFT_859295 [Pluteus cervinus]